MWTLSDACGRAAILTLSLLLVVGCSPEDYGDEEALYGEEVYGQEAYGQAYGEEAYGGGYPSMDGTPSGEAPWTQTGADDASGLQAGQGERVYREASEGAFSVVIPEGWSMQSGIDRSRGSGTSWYVLTSPDGQIEIRTPDAPSALYIVPDAQNGLREGGQMGPFQARSVLPATAYAASHVQRAAQAIGCTGVRVVDRRERPDLVQRTRQFMTVPATRLDIAEARATCTHSGRPLQMVVGVTIGGMQQPGMGEGWFAATSRMIAPQPRASEARRVLDRVQQTHTPNMEWLAREAERNRRRMAAQRPRGSSGGSSGGSVSGGSSSDQGHSDYIDSIHGTEDLTDRHGDTRWGVSSQGGTHWEGNDGSIVETEIDENPDPLEYTRMPPADG